MKKNSKYVGILALAALGLFALLGSACGSEKVTLAATDSGSMPQGISVSGEGKATGQPDIAMLSLGVTAMRSTVATARDDAATAMQNVIDSIKNDSVDKKDVQTTEYNISPEYDYSQGGQGKLVGYRVTNTVTVKVRKINDTSKILDDVTAAGGDIVQVQGISFTIDAPNSLQDQAREDAVKDARARAQRLADVAGVKLGNPISIIDGYSPQPLYQNKVAFGTADLEAAPSVPIETGQMDVDVTVQVVFAIE